MIGSGLKLKHLKAKTYCNNGSCSQPTRLKIDGVILFDGVHII